MSPRTANFTPEAFKALQVIGDGVVVLIPLHHALQPETDSGNRLMPPAHQRLPKRQQRCPHSLLRGEANDLEPTLPILAATVSKSEEVEGFRSTLIPPTPIDSGESTTLDYPRLLGMQSQSEVGEAFLQRSQETSRGLLTLESEHTIISVANNDDITPSVPPPLMHP